MSTPQLISERVVRLGTPLVNWYLVADETGVTIVDTALPGYRDQLEPGLSLLDRTIDDVRAIVLTHGDQDHIGVATVLGPERGTPIHLHPADDEIAKQGKQKPADGSRIAVVRHATALKLFWHFARNGALPPKKVGETLPLGEAAALDVPGHPRVIATPGHSAGHVVFLFADHGALFVGDALCTRGPVSARLGPQLMPRSFNVSNAEAIESLKRLEGLEAAQVLPGHGDPWTEGPDAAVAAARAAGTSN
jgi:glyoxylase-like metal-dependent hydrolase (beta-lactamase superfamily II)